MRLLECGHVVLPRHMRTSRAMRETPGDARTYP